MERNFFVSNRDREMYCYSPYSPSFCLASWQLQGVRRPENYKLPPLCFSYVASRVRQPIPHISLRLLAGRVLPEVGTEQAGWQHFVAASQVGTRGAGAAANSKC